MSAETPRRRRILECLAELPVEEAFIFAIDCSTKAKSHAVNLCFPLDIYDHKSPLDTASHICAAMSVTGRQEVARDEASAEAGPGAATTNAVPTNQLMEDIENNSTSSASTKHDDVPPQERPQLERKDSTPLEERSKGKIALIMTALGMAVFLAALDVTIITTALPTISEYFHSAAGYTWIGSAYLLGNASSVPLWGKISDIFGRKPVLIVANLLFLIGSLIAALSNSIGMLIAARAIQGVGGGGLVTLVNICISDLFSLRRRGAYFGIIGGVWALASAIGPVIGGVFTEKVSWRWCFYINLPLDGAALVIIFFFLDLKTPRTPLWEGLKAIDWIGALLVIGGVLMFLFGLEYGGVTYPWDSATVLCLIIMGVFTMVLFFINEWKFAKSPVMPLRIFQNRSNIAVLGVCAIHGMVFISASYYLPLYFQAARGATPLLSGVYILPQALSLSFASMATGIFIRKTGQYLPAIWFGMVFLVLGFGLFVDFQANSSWAKLIIFQIIAGIGIGEYPLLQHFAVVKANMISRSELPSPLDRASNQRSAQRHRHSDCNIRVCSPNLHVHLRRHRPSRIPKPDERKNRPPCSSARPRGRRTTDRRWRRCQHRSHRRSSSSTKACCPDGICTELAPHVDHVCVLCRVWPDCELVHQEEGAQQEAYGDEDRT